MFDESEKNNPELNPPVISSQDSTTKTSTYLDILIVLLIAVIPDFYRATTVLIFPELLIDYPFNFIWSQIAIRAITVTPVVLYIMWLRKENFKDFGFKKISIPNDLFSGILLFIATYSIIVIFTILLSLILPKHIITLGVVENYNFFRSPSNIIQILIFIISIILNSISEEIIARGYLITKFLKLNNSKYKAVIYSSILFSSYHIYQGIMAFISIFILGCVYGIFFIKYRKLFPLIIAHTLQNMVIIAFMNQ